MESSKPKIAVIVPTIREACFEQFFDAWMKLFIKHDVELFKVADGFIPEVYICNDFVKGVWELNWSRSDCQEADLFSDHNPACRNLGFYAAAVCSPKFDVFITLDDDCFPPKGKDPLQEHLNALDRRWPTSWFSTTNHTDYTRGFPYSIRSESECVVSHGLWTGNLDYDAPTQLFSMNPWGDIQEEPMYRGPIPKGVWYPHCGMNVAFKREILPFYYHCPVENFPGCERFDDIWMGMELKKAVDNYMPGKCIVSGCSTVHHIRASDPFQNLAKEAVGIKINETLWKDQIDEEYEEFFQTYRDKRRRYEDLLKPLV